MIYLSDYTMMTVVVVVVVVLVAYMTTDPHPH